MTGKLIKYEIKSSIKLMGCIWIALIAAALLLSLVGLTLRNVLPEDLSQSVVGMLMEVIPALIYFAIFIVLIVVTVFIVITRFYGGLLGEEGYLMHTLPVKPWQLITAKGAVAAGIVIVGLMAALLSILILNGVGDVRALFRGINEFIETCTDRPGFLLVVVESLLILVLSVLKSIYQIYAALAIGQTAEKHRLLISFGAYVGITFVLVILAIILLSVGSATGIEEKIFDLFQEASAYARVQAIAGCAFLLTFVQLAAFHVIAERLLSKHLNLQ